MLCMGYTIDQSSEPPGEDETERRALEAAVAEARADPRSAPRVEVCGWLLRLASGEADAPPAPAVASAVSRIDTVSWTAAALVDVERIAGRAAGEIPIAARCLARELLFAGDALSFFPRRGRPGLIAGTREVYPVRPYVLVHEVREDDSVVILRVWRSAQGR
jgi:toxin ParE1/3/4